METPIYKEFSGKDGGNGDKLLLRSFTVESRGKCFSMRTVRHGNNLPREVVDFLPLGSFKTHLDTEPSHFS